MKKKSIEIKFKAPLVAHLDPVCPSRNVSILGHRNPFQPEIEEMAHIVQK